MNLKKEAFKGIQWTTVASFGNSIIQLLKTVILARLLEKSDFGLMAIVSTVIGFMNLFSDMGVGSAILYKQNSTSDEYSSLYWFNFILSIILLCIICFISPFISRFYREPQLISAIPLMGVSLIFTAFGHQYAIIAQKELLFRFISLSTIISQVISLIPAIVMAISGFGIYALIVSTLCANILCNSLYFIGMRKRHRVTFHYKFSETKPFLKIGLYQTAGGISNYFTTQLDVIILGRIWGTDLLGMYSLSKNLAIRPMQIINPIVTKVSAPILSKVQNNGTLLRNGYLKIIRWLSFSNCPIYCLFALLSLPVIRIVYGMNDPSMALVLSILSLFYMLRSLGNPIGSLLIAMGRTDLGFYWDVTMLIISPFFIYFGSAYSPVGLGIVLLLLTILEYVPFWFFVIKKIINVTLRDYFLQTGPYLLYSFLAAVSSYLFLKKVQFHSDIIELIGGFILFACVYIIVVILFDKEIYMIFKNVIRRRVNCVKE